MRPAKQDPPASVVPLRRTPGTRSKSKSNADLLVRKAGERRRQNLEANKVQMEYYVALSQLEQMMRIACRSRTRQIDDNPVQYKVTFECPPELPVRINYAAYQRGEFNDDV